MTGMVTYNITDPEKNFDALQSMSVPNFLASVGFLSEEDMDAMFQLIDVELGEEAYGGMTEEGFRSSMDMEGINCDDPKFQKLLQNVLFHFGVKPE